MTNTVPQALSDITAAWLAEALDRPITAVEIEPQARWNLADLAFARATVAGEAAPLKLFVKLRAEPDPLRHVFAGEWRFYQRAGGGFPTPRPFLVRAGEETGRSLVILEDMRDTHATIAWPDPPDVADACHAVRSLSRCHAADARRWSGLTPAEQAAWRAHQRALAGVIAKDIDPFLRTMAEWCPDWDMTPLESALRTGLDRRLAHVAETNAWLTTIHGDFHPWNVLYPKTGDSPALLIDWEYHLQDLPAIDLANLLWRVVPSTWRAKHGETVLNAYNIALLNKDMRLDEEELAIAHLANAEIPVHLWREGVPKENWIRELETWLAATERAR